MPPWSFALIIALVVLAWISVQFILRRLFQGLEGLARRVATLGEEVAAARDSAQAASAGVAELHGVLEASGEASSDERLKALESIVARVAAVETGLERLGETVSTLSRDVVRVGGRLTDLASTGSGPEDAETVARKWLRAEGFTGIELSEGEIDAAGVSFRVRATRGQELRTGVVVVVGDAVKEARLRVPSGLFP